MEEDTRAPDVAGGSQWEITAAADALTASWLAYVDDPTPERKGVYAEAARRHQAAVSGASMSAMASLVAPILAKIEALSGKVDGLDGSVQSQFSYMLSVIDQHLKTTDARVDKVWDKVSEQGAKLDRLTDDIVVSKADRADLRQQVKDIKTKLDWIPSLEGTDTAKTLKKVQEEIRQIRVQLWLTFGAVALIVLIFAIAVIVGGGR